ncbi:MAG: hypothetical protein GWO02_22115, partial [Gammaproteobacteria bacterium]|nr:hypothetical protein [Gammaproteobacteria bacterium]
RRARKAGVRLVMATGDQAPTAEAIAASVALADTPRVIEGKVISAVPEGGDASDEQAVIDADVIARATPEQKLRLLRMHQRRGAVVAML